MSKVVRERLQQTIQCMEEATGFIGIRCANVSAEKPENVQLVIELLTDTQNLAIAFGTRVEKLKGLGTRTVEELEKYCECLFYVNESIGMADAADAIKNLTMQLELVKSAFEVDFPNKKEIVFLPYKASMWDSLESVWMAAKADPECEVYVIPIPYYDRNPDGTFGTFHYEGDMYPDYLEVTSYEEYNIEDRCPDIIYIHNPYDEYNLVTSVAPDFYSHNLKKYTKCLVYIPYFLAGYYFNEQKAVFNIPRCINNIDIWILQGEMQKKIFSINKQIADKLVVLGSPKIDKMVHLSGKTLDAKLEKKIQGRNTILVNTSISRILNDQQWFTKMRQLIMLFQQRKDLFMIWRPHPLLFATISAMRSNKMKEMEEIVDLVNELDNTYIDMTPSADCAIAVSDGLISDYSSLVLQYTAIEKPVLLTVGKSKFRETRLVCGDYFSNYFMQDGETVEDFFEMIKNKNDYKKVERMRYFRNSIVNTDGTCGEKIHAYIKKLGEKNGV